MFFQLGSVAIPFSGQHVARFRAPMVSSIYYIPEEVLSSSQAPRLLIPLMTRLSEVFLRRLFLFSSEGIGLEFVLALISQKPR